ncbi:winged helix-turn-helix transcriptional regulator [Sporosarcina sp. FSL K6-1540]|uniref:LexA family protein n=1 Tax=Sporosarcina sp. FSL K6-1540 TaxID=2921555 RepID=UPI00315B09D0
MRERQQRIYEFILKYIRENQYSPTIREIAVAVGLKSPSTVHGHLDRMRDKGIIDFVDSLPRTIRILECAR